MTNIFGTGASKIFRDRSVLSSRYMPEELVGRDKEIKELVEIIRPVLHHGEPANAIISGNKGTGKTTVVRYVLKQLIENIGKDDLNVVPVFINCQKINTTSRIIQEILNKVSPEAEVPRTGLSMGKYYRALWKALNETHYTIIVVFDEIELLKNHTILYDLSHAGENMSIEDDIFIGIIGITDDLTFHGQLEQSIVSALQQKNLVFRPYDSDQITQILEKRNTSAFAERALNSEIIKLCVELAGEEGNASKVVALLEKAGNIADTSGSGEITENHIRLANEEMGDSELIRSMEKLPFNSKLVLLSIVKLTKELNDKVTTGQIEAIYRKFCEETNTDPLGRTSVSRIVSEFDMEGFISAPVRSRGRYGKTRLVALKKSPHKIETALHSDYRLKQLRIN